MGPEQKLREGESSNQKPNQPQAAEVPEWIPDIGFHANGLFVKVIRHLPLFQYLSTAAAIRNHRLSEGESGDKIQVEIPGQHGKLECLLALAVGTFVQAQIFCPKGSGLGTVDNHA